MDDGPSIDHEAVVAANSRVHSILAERYNDVEPHFRPENVQKVRRRLERLSASSATTGRLLDLGCGTGFILGLAHDLYEELHGVDVTPSMLERVDLSPGNISLHQGIVERLPFPDRHFDAVTAYSFLDHLADHRIALREAARVVKPGGGIYVDLVPNRDFWSAIFRASTLEGRPFSPVVEREINELVNHEQLLHERFGIDPADWRLAEPAKSDQRGFDPQELTEDFAECGFDVIVEHEWFLGQAKVIHEESSNMSDRIDEYLRGIHPTSRHLFKYLVVTGTRT